MQVGDRVLSYDKDRRIYLVGTIRSGYRYDPKAVGETEHYPNVREVDWQREILRDDLTVRARNSLGAISTLFQVSDDAADDIELLIAGGAPADQADESEAEEEIRTSIEDQAKERVKDRISRLDWGEMQELVAGLLRAMGYKTRVSDAGADRGKDIVASPDGFGFEHPRIVVEVKHRSSAMGSQEIRSFLGGRHKDDKGLYVSTGGFTKDAYYEAERATIPIALMTLDDLVRTLIDHYDLLDTETRQLLPLTKIYWPV